MGQTMTITELLKVFSALSLLYFSFYMVHQNKDDRTRRRWKNIIAMIMLLYFSTEMIVELHLLPG
jgi:hypothetical protein